MDELRFSGEGDKTHVKRERRKDRKHRIFVVIQVDAYRPSDVDPETSRITIQLLRIFDIDLVD